MRSSAGGSKVKPDVRQTPSAQKRIHTKSADIRYYKLTWLSKPLMCVSNIVKV